jgi:hypothetical protein
MQMPHVFLACAAQPPALSCAVAYLVSGYDAYGWFIGRRNDGSYASAYFLLEDLFAGAPGRYEAVADVHADWSLGERLRHELAAMQEIFAREWLAYGEGSVSVRGDQLGKLSKGAFYSRNFERPVLNHLSKHWPLEYRPNMERTAAAQKRRRAKHARP